MPPPGSLQEFIELLRVQHPRHSARSKMNSRGLGEAKTFPRVATRGRRGIAYGDGWGRLGTSPVNLGGAHSVGQLQ